MFPSFIAIVPAVVCLAAWSVWRVRTALNEDTTWAFLVSRVPWEDEPLTAERLDALPDAARRFFAAALGNGNVSQTVFEGFLEVEQGTRFADIKGQKGAIIHQAIAAPYGAVWKMSGSGGLRASAGVTTARTWAQERIWSLLPRAPGISKAELYGQMLLEAAMWAPASILRKADAEWGGEGAVATARIGCESVKYLIALTIDGAGRLTEVEISSEAVGGPSLSATVQTYAAYQGISLPARVTVQRGKNDDGCTLKLLRHRFPEVWSSPRRG